MVVPLDVAEAVLVPLGVGEMVVGVAVVDDDPSPDGVAIMMLVDVAGKAEEYARVVDTGDADDTVDAEDDGETEALASLVAVPTSDSVVLASEAGA